jgi:ribonuclease G
MAKELIVSVNGREKKIAILEDDVVTEFYVERGDENQGIVGNIYKGRVMKVLPGMQSAFVDIGLERDAFLYVSDFFDDEEFEGALEDQREAKPAARQERQEGRPERAERPERSERPERPERPERQRPSRFTPSRVAAQIEEVEEVEESEDELDLSAVALSHIEEIGEEPIIERVSDELGDAAQPDADALDYLAPAAEADTPERRRHRRLHYVEPEEEAEAAPAAVEETPAEAAPEAEAAESADGEAPEEPSGRRRRRPRRKRGAEAAETTEAAPEAAPEVVEAVAKSKPTREERAAARARVAAETVFEPTPLALPPAEPMERVSDDDVEAAPAARKRRERTPPAEERRVVKFEAEPTPEIQVGALRASLRETGDFERVSDDEAAEPSTEAASQPAQPTTTESEEVAAPAPAEAAGAGEETAEAAPPAAETQADGPEAQTQAESKDGAEDERPFALAELPDVSLVAEEPPLADAEAEVRERQSRADFATRRGGRSRRRPFVRSQVTDATADADAAPEESEAEEGEPRERERAAERAPSPSFSRSTGERTPPSSAPPSRPTNGRQGGRPAITELLREGQEVLVQIAKEPIGQKGARITSHVVLPGRYIVYMPTVEHIGVSRKIGTDEERMRLKKTLHQLRAEVGIPGGFIVRTAANGRTLEELREDVQYLGRTWSEMRRRSDRAKAPAIVHRDLDLVQRILRDQLSSDFSAIRVDNEFEYERVIDFVNRFAPRLVNRVKLYTKETPILEEYGVQAEIDKAVKPRVWLKSGGYIVINQTEALVAIDVNTGKFVGRSNRLEDTIVKTNLEAAKEIVRQIRLRDLGGIIVLDFIDMEERRNRIKVMQALEQELRNDKSPSKVLQFNDFGLVAVTRKRVKQSLERTLCTPCPYCTGAGMVKSPQTVCYEILAETRRISKHLDHQNEVILRVNPEVAKALRSSERDVFGEIEAVLGTVVSIKSDQSVHQEQFDIALV